MTDKKLLAMLQKQEEIDQRIAALEFSMKRNSANFQEIESKLASMNKVVDELEKTT